MNVYVLIQDYWDEGKQVVGVYSTLDLADQALVECHKLENGARYYIETHVMNEGSYE